MENHKHPIKMFLQLEACTQARIVTTCYNIKFNKIHIHWLHSTHTHINTGKSTGNGGEVCVCVCVGGGATGSGNKRRMLLKRLAALIWKRINNCLCASFLTEVTELPYPPKTTTHSPLSHRWWEAYWLNLFNSDLSLKSRWGLRSVGGGGGRPYITLHCHHQNEALVTSVLVTFM